MAHGYHTLQFWHQWLMQSFLGQHLLEEETSFLSCLLQKHFGKHALLLGVPHQSKLLSSTPIPLHLLATPFLSKDKNLPSVETDFHDLPLLTGSIDLVLLPHTLEFVDNPRQLLAEACRIIKPEGLIAICGFNPFSTWGVKKILTKRKSVPWEATFIQPHQVKNWLHLADFEIETYSTILFRPPLNEAKLYNQLHFLERIGKICFPKGGGVYILLARAKVIPLTPIRLTWKQQLSNIPISTTISGNIARNKCD